MGENPENVVIFLIPVAAVIAIGALLSVIGYARERRREREALYRHETARAALEKDRMDADAFQAFLREEVQRPHRARIEAVKLFGLVCALLGVGMVFGMRNVEELPVRGIGWMPAGMGVGALLYAFVLARREP
jgi:hypothetical protein